MTSYRKNGTTTVPDRGKLSFRDYRRQCKLWAQRWEREYAERWVEINGLLYPADSVVGK